MKVHTILQALPILNRLSLKISATKVLIPIIPINTYSGQDIFYGAQKG